MDLDSVGIATPCHASWEDMRGDARVRFCGKCRLNVYNLSEMGRKEAEALVREKEGRLCVRFFRRPDGTLLTKDCGLLVRARKRAAWAWGAGVAALLALTAWAGSRIPTLGPILARHVKPPISRPAMGVVVPPPQALQGDIAGPTMGEATAPSLDSAPDRF